MGLVQMWESCFAERGLHTAQVLLTHEDLGDRRRYLNARTTLKTLVSLGVVPVINENDTVVVDEIRFGDNDTLASLVTNLIEADALAILTDQKGLFSTDPRKDPSARLVERATAGDSALEAMAGGAGSEIGSGGMITKVLAARRAARSGAHTVIAWGREPDLLTRLFSGESIGSLLVADTPPVAARKQWLADHLKPAGHITLDAGAVKALVADRKSLLAIGATAVAGDFERGEVVSVHGPDGREIARGLVNYGAAETARILRKPTAEIEPILGYLAEPELIHRDNLVVL
jgi:glutamate 5-kinase